MRLAIVLCTLAAVGISFTAEASNPKQTVGPNGADHGKAHKQLARQRQQAAKAQQNAPSSDPPAVKASGKLTMAYPTYVQGRSPVAYITWSDGTVYADAFHVKYRVAGNRDYLEPHRVESVSDSLYYSALRYPSPYDDFEDYGDDGTGYSVTTMNDEMSCTGKTTGLSCTQGQQTFTVTMTGTNISVNGNAVATFTKPTLTLTGQVTNYELLAIVNFLLKDAKN